VPYVYVDWCKFTAVDFSRTCFKGHINRDEWYSGPRTRIRGKSNPFVCADELIPSRSISWGGSGCVGGRGE
jgi:hypothetical protein